MQLLCYMLRPVQDLQNAKNGRVTGYRSCILRSMEIDKKKSGFHARYLTLYMIRDKIKQDNMEFCAVLPIWTVLLLFIVIYIL